MGIIDEESLFDDRISHTNIIKETVEDQLGNRYLDYEVPMQVFTGLLYERFDSLTIESKRFLAKGGFGEIFKAHIKELNGSKNVLKTPFTKN